MSENRIDLGRQAYRTVLDRVRGALESRMPGGFRISLETDDPARVGALYADRPDAAGFAEVFAVSRMISGGGWTSQGGVVWKDADVFYSASHYTESRTPGAEKELRPLECYWSANAEEVAAKIIDWSFPPPRQAPPPVGDEEIARLGAIANGRRNRFTDDARRAAAELRSRGRLADAFRAVGLEPTFDLQRPDAPLDGDSAAAFRDDIRHLLPDQLVWNFPIQDDGRLPLGATVVLAVYATTAPQGRFRRLCLAAHSPQRRRDGSAIRLELTPLIPENESHRWDAARTLWDEREVAGGPERRWGVAGIPMELLAPQTRGRNLARLGKVCVGDAGSPGQRAALATLLQDQGRFEEALGLFGVEIGPHLWKVIGGERTRLPLCHPPVQPSWVAACRRALRCCAPWLIRPTLSAARESREGWAAANRGRHIPVFRLFALPGQHHLRKVTLMLEAVDADLRRVRFELDGSGSNARLADVKWKRPLDIDLMRYGLSQGVLASQ